ncbi:MAG: aminodeoxychorismate synthase component I [Clostridia bacterium]
MVIKSFESELAAFEIYKIFEEDKYSFILDSSMRDENLGRYSFIGSEPFLVFKSKGRKIELTEQNKTICFEGNPFTEISNIMARYNVKKDAEIPFTGGAVGYLSYDLCQCIEELPDVAIDDINAPDSILGLYDGIIAVDNLENKFYAIAQGIFEDEKIIAEKLINKIRNSTKTESQNGKNSNNSTAKICLGNRRVGTSKADYSIRASITKSAYIETIKKIKSYIRSGDIYQVNYTYRYNCRISKKPLEIYETLRLINPAPFAAYLNFGGLNILSSSPERFMKIQEKQMETRPIKGTCPRGKNDADDIKNREGLLKSEKDKAELLMIVDLERNDLGKVAEMGSIVVKESFHAEKYATVYHLVSSVTGTVDCKYSAIDCIKAAFPGGSITGVPKIRAMEIIDEIESTKRSVYTGCIGYIGFEGNLDLNIAIRTILIKGDIAYFQVGGGIVWDSDAEAEYQETLDKAKALIEALQT